VTAYFCSSGTNVMRGSSMPQISSGWFSGLGIKVGSRSICQPSQPFRERATHRWDKPRRSSTRHSSKVVPSASSVAPALNTLLMGYGQCLPVRIGLPGWRIRSDSWRTLKVFEGFCAETLIMGFPFVEILAGIAFQGAPSGTIASIPPPDFRWRGRDASRPGSRRLPNHKELVADHCRRGTS
jgi:hypothetical protein